MDTGVGNSLDKKLGKKCRVVDRKGARNCKLARKGGRSVVGWTGKEPGPGVETEDSSGGFDGLGKGSGTNS